MLARSYKIKVPILLYHSISDHASPKFKQFTVPPGLFADHMAYLRENAYTPITITCLVCALSQEDSALPAHPVVITFDDGFADFFTEALPVLKRYSFVATLYIATAFVNGTSCWLQREGEANRPMLSWDQLAEINASGIECGAHSHCHPQLDILPPAFVWHEIVHSKKLLERHLGQTISSFAYPFGYHTAAMRQQVREAGYTSACAVKHGMSTEKTDPFALARLVVKAPTSVDALASLLNGRISSAVEGTFFRARTSGWQLVRRSLASVTGHQQRRLFE